MLRRVVPEDPAACPFNECDGSTWILDEETGDAHPCRCREQRVRQAVSGGTGTGIGRRFLEVSFDREPIVSLDRSVLQPVRTFVSNIDSNLDAGRGLWFDGPPGTGKTSLAILIAKEAKKVGRTYAVYPVPRLLAEIKRTFDRDASDTYLGFFRRLCTVDVLVLDDLGAQKQTEWVLEQLYSIVNERWQDERSIVVTTNVPDPDPDAPIKLLRQSTQELREASRSHRAGDDDEALRRIVERLERVAGELASVDGVTDLDPVARLRRQIGARTVSRLREICEEPLPVWGEDLRVAQGA